MWCKDCRAGLTCVLDSHMRQQEIFTEGAVGTEAAFEGLVTNVGQLVVQQCLLVLTNKLTELTLEPGGSLKGGGLRNMKGSFLAHGLPVATYLRFATAWMCVSRCILKV